MLKPNEIVVDLFAGGGGASTGIAQAIGRDPDLAVNHDPQALAIYAANHPNTRLFCESVFDVEPRFAVGKRPVGLLWASPDCTFFSKARGAKPHRDRHKARRRRGLAGVVLKWAASVKPRVIVVENVEEFQQWGPLGADGQPDPDRLGTSFQRWVSRLRNLGYAVEWRELRACDYGAPTSRKRLFIIARCDGQPIAWPEKTHGPGRAHPFRTAAECIDWSIPCPSIFGRKKPLAEATLRRIARGIRKYVIEAKQPFIVPLTHRDGSDRARGVDDVMPTVTGANRGELAVVAPTLVGIDHRGAGDSATWSAAEPLRTVTTENRHAVVAPLLSPVKSWGGGGNEAAPADRPLRTTTTSKRGEFAVVAPTLIQMGHGEREGQAPRALDIQAPLGTVTAGGNHHGLVTAFLAKHYGGPNGQQTPGSQMDLPMGTVTAVDHHAVVTSHLLQLRGGLADHGVTGRDMREPAPTVTASGTHLAEVRAFLIKYYGTEQDPQLGLPLHTVTTKDRFGLVTVTIDGAEYAIVDIGMRMLSPRELFNAQGFPADYVIDPVVDGKPLTKTEQVHKCGNSVPPPFSRALVGANYTAAAAGRAARATVA